MLTESVLFPGQKWAAEPADLQVKGHVYLELNGGAGRDSEPRLLCVLHVKRCVSQGDSFKRKGQLWINYISVWMKPIKKDMIFKNRYHRGHPLTEKMSQEYNLDWISTAAEL